MSADRLQEKLYSHLTERAADGFRSADGIGAGDMFLSRMALSRSRRGENSFTMIELLVTRSGDRKNPRLQPDATPALARTF